MSNLILFENKQVRRLWSEEKQRWFFSIIDVCEILSETDNPRRYWSDLKRKLKSEGLNELYEIIVQLKLEAEDGKIRLTDCADAQGLLRIIQSIPSPKAEPFKRWLAKVGYERLEEIENPELAAKRMREIYQQKGYSADWIEKRMRGIAIRDELTGEWKKRGVKEQIEYAILTAEISKATFGMTPAEYKIFKDLENPNDNLRDHMTDLELIFSMLGEASTTEIARKKDAQGFPANKKAAFEGGTVAGNARRELEEKSGTRVSTNENYKELPEIKHKALK
ncbi:MAG: Bro-N domain-containing protein [Dehalococcoidia bacterium]|nr:Bro-N domain-containing protein [Dehalococcoidia bacterium]